MLANSHLDFVWVTIRRYSRRLRGLIVKYYAVESFIFYGGKARNEAFDVTNNSRHLGRHLGFYQDLEIRLKPREILIFGVFMKNNT